MHEGVGLRGVDLALNWAKEDPGFHFPLFLQIPEQIKNYSLGFLFEVQNGFPPCF